MEAGNAQEHINVLRVIGPVWLPWNAEFERRRRHVVLSDLFVLQRMEGGSTLSFWFEGQVFS